MRDTSGWPDRVPWRGAGMPFRCGPQRPSLTSCGTCQPADEQHDGGGVEEGRGGGDGGLEGLGETAIAVEPRDAPFHDPPARLHGEAAPRTTSGGRL